MIESPFHSIKPNEVISTLGEQIAIADSYEIWEAGKGYKTVGEATVRILGCADTHIICTNFHNVRGVVCFLPEDYKGCAILSVRVTRVFSKSVEAIPIDYIKGDKPIECLCHGMDADKLLTDGAFPNIKRFHIGTEVSA